MAVDLAVGAPLLIVVSGPSGAGKTTIARAVEKAFPDSLFSVSLTTRAPGPNDRDGVDYHFVSEEEFEKRATPRPGAPFGDFLECAGVYGRRYGTLRKPVEDALGAGRLVILEIDVQGAANVHDAMPDAYGVFVLPPSEDALLARLRARKRDDEDAIQRRFAAARKEIAKAKSGEVYSFFVVNDDLDRAIRETIHAVAEERRFRAGRP